MTRYGRKSLLKGLSVSRNNYVDLKTNKRKAFQIKEINLAEAPIMKNSQQPFSVITTN